MRILRRPVLLLLAIAAPGACGGNVVLDGMPSGSAGTGGAGTATVTGTGASTTMTAVGVGGAAVATAVSVGPTTTTTTTAGVGGAGGGGACTNPSDLMFLAEMTAEAIVEKCAAMTTGAEPALEKCIKAATGLSDACVACFDGDIACVIQHCLGQCLSNPASAPCVACRKANCQPAFMKCSGVPGG